MDCWQTVWYNIVGRDADIKSKDGDTVRTAEQTGRRHAEGS